MVAVIGFDTVRQDLAAFDNIVVGFSPSISFLYSRNAILQLVSETLGRPANRSSFSDNAYLRDQRTGSSGPWTAKSVTGERLRHGRI